MGLYIWIKQRRSNIFKRWCDVGKPRNGALKEEEIRPEHLKENQAVLIASDIRMLMAHKHEFVKVVCPACGSRNHVPLFCKSGMKYVVCKKCETAYVSPRPTPRILESFYSRSKNYEYWNKYIFPASERSRREKIFRPRVDSLINICKRYKAKHEILLEIGAGFGTFCEEARATRFFSRVIAVEPTPDLAETCRRKGIEVIAKPVEQVRLQDIKADVVASFEVIEHLFDPRGFIKGCSSLLSKGGLLLITCPNVKGFDMELLRKSSKTFDYEHLNYFHPESLSRLMEKFGLEVIEVSTPGKLDAELVRKEVVKGEVDLLKQPFLRRILIEQWDELGAPFQQFLADNLLSSHMWIVGRKQ
jgi:2-polyprenyl-3-methyl-5-hydroxy-6-metoxy-1,4-benzoquinol methylase